MWPVILCLGGHMMNSMAVGIVFAALMVALKLRDDISPIAVGVAYGLGIWIVMRYVILPLNEGEDDLFTTATVTPQWVWWVAHAALGMTAGIVYDIARRIVAAPQRLEFRQEEVPRAV